MSKNRFEVTESSGFYQVEEGTELPYEEADTQGTITEQSEEQ